MLGVWVMPNTLWLSCVFVLLAAGCANFEHPLPWKESADSKQLVGNWRSIDDAVTPYDVSIEQSPNGSLVFDIDLRMHDAAEIERPSFVRSDDAQRVSFEGRLLAMDDVHLLEVAMDTYQEMDAMDDSISSASERGFQFVQVISDGAIAEFRMLDISSLGFVAEADLAEAMIQLAAPKYVACLNDEVINGHIASVFKALIADGEMPDTAFSDTSLAELEQAVADYQSLQVDPFEELASLRTCVTLKLPGERVGELFYDHSQAVFTGPVERIVRVPALD